MSTDTRYDSTADTLCHRLRVGKLIHQLVAELNDRSQSLSNAQSRTDWVVTPGGLSLKLIPSTTGRKRLIIGGIL